VSEKEPKQAGALAIRHIAVLEQANNVLLELTELVWKAINDVCHDVVHRKAWDGKFESTEQQWFAPTDWRSTTTGTPERTATIVVDCYGDSDTYWLTALCGVGEDRVGFWWRFQYQYLTGKVAWKKFAVDANRHHSLREKFGFEYVSDAGEWFLPFKLDEKLLATAYETEDWTKALKPVSDALEKVEAAMPTFTAIIDEAKAAFKVS
jgi:hypothetical protein